MDRPGTTHGHERIDVPCECSQCAPFNQRDVVSFEWRDGWCETDLSETVEERHEFHLLDHYTAWCSCGWTYGTDYSDLNFTGSLGLLTQGYRDHLNL